MRRLEVIDHRQTDLNYEDEGCEDGAPEHVVVSGRLPDGLQVLQELIVRAERTNCHAHPFN